MKNTNFNAAYESPAIDLLYVESEGVLCESTAKGKHSGFTNGNDIIF